MDLDPGTIAALAATAFVAGFVDAIAGGGGLITIPAMALAGLDPVVALATNKLQGTFGAASATWSFARAGHIDLRRMAAASLTSAAGSVAGVLALSRLPHDFIGRLLPFALIAVALYFWLSPRAGDLDGRARLSETAFTFGFVPLTGAYDGAFGPGAGSFFMMGFVALRGMGMVRATAHTKLCNFASNIAALAIWAVSGQILWPLGLAMGVAQIAGARIGAALAMKNGTRLVRPLLVTICLALALRLAWQQARLAGLLPL